MLVKLFNVAPFLRWKKEPLQWNRSFLVLPQEPQFQGSLDSIKEGSRRSSVPSEMVLEVLEAVEALVENQNQILALGSQSLH